MKFHVKWAKKSAAGEFLHKVNSDFQKKSCAARICALFFKTQVFIPRFPNILDSGTQHPDLGNEKREAQECWESGSGKEEDEEERLVLTIDKRCLFTTLEGETHSGQRGICPRLHGAKGVTRLAEGGACPRLLG